MIYTIEGGRERARNREVRAHQEYVRGSAGIDPPFLISALNGGEQSASRPDRFTPVPDIMNYKYVQ